MIDPPSSGGERSPAAHGLLLAAGGGRRMGVPKALVHDPDGTSWLLRSVQALREGGCREVTVVLGARADEAGALLDGSGARLVVAADWAEGLAASLRAGLASLDPTTATLAVVLLVDLPDVGADVIRRVREVANGRVEALARATYSGSPGHPVVIGAAHWQGAIAASTGDAGARGYLAGRAVELVECGDLATGRDRDTPTEPGENPAGQ